MLIRDAGPPKADQKAGATGPTGTVAWDYPAVRFGATVSSGIDFNGDGNEDMLVGPGPDPEAPAQLKVFGYDGSETSLLFSFNAFDSEITHGINAAGGSI